MTDLRESLSAKVTALFTDAMRADPQEIAVRLEGFPTPTAAFLRRSRTTALAGAAALSGVLNGAVRYWNCPNACPIDPYRALMS